MEYPKRGRLSIFKKKMELYKKNLTLCRRFHYWKWQRRQTPSIVRIWLAWIRCASSARKFCCFQSRPTGKLHLRMSLPICLPKAQSLRWRWSDGSNEIFVNLIFHEPIQFDYDWSDGADDLDRVASLRRVETRLFQQKLSSWQSNIGELSVDPTTAFGAVMSSYKHFASLVHQILPA